MSGSRNNLRLAEGGSFVRKQRDSSGQQRKDAVDLIVVAEARNTQEVSTTGFRSSSINAKVRASERTGMGWLPRS